jgi:hypothetical protein
MQQLMRSRNFSLIGLVLFTIAVATTAPANGQLRTWDGQHRTDAIDVTMVYYVPKNATPLPDWKERLNYYAGRIERFHAREFDGQSVLNTKVIETPFRSKHTTEELRRGDANAIFFRTLREVDSDLQFGRGERRGFPILLVLSEINWRPLDDFYRVKPQGDGWQFEGNYHAGRHFPGAESGGARATYLADRGVGWGLVSGDGWRVPYSGTDCVVYHEGVGHSIGLPHNEPADGAVMSLGQYNGWISQSWIDEGQKKKLGWIAPETPLTSNDLFTQFSALPEPLVPRPNTEVKLRLKLPKDAKVKNIRTQIQTDVHGPWLDVSTTFRAPIENGADVALGKFDRATPVSYRVDVELVDGPREELWGYFQVRESPDEIPLPPKVTDAADADAGLAQTTLALPAGESLDLLAEFSDPKQIELHSVLGNWSFDGRALTSPKTFGARIELPAKTKLPENYELVVIAEPLDEPNSLILGQQMSGTRFLTLINFQAGPGRTVSALENVDGQNFDSGPTTVDGVQLKKNQLTQIVVRVQKNLVTVDCDGRSLIRWSGDAKRLSLSDYWATKHTDRLFLGAYDCRYRFHRVTLTPLKTSAAMR